MVSTMASTVTPVVFSFNSVQVRAFADDNGEPWFSAMDICAVLGYSNDSDAIKKHCREKGVAKHGSLAEGNNQCSTYINEGNLYRLIINSRKEEAQAFEVKVTEEILPAIRKAGIHHTIRCARTLPCPTERLAADRLPCVRGTPM